MFDFWWVPEAEKLARREANTNFSMQVCSNTPNFAVYRSELAALWLLASNTEIKVTYDAYLQWLRPKTLHYTK